MGHCQWDRPSRHFQKRARFRSQYPNTSYCHVSARRQPRRLGISKGLHCLWDTQSGVFRKVPFHSHFSHAAFSLDRGSFVAGSEDGRFCVCDTHTGQPVGASHQRGPSSTSTGTRSNSVLCMAFSPTGLWAAVGYSDGTLQFWNLETLRLMDCPFKATGLGYGLLHFHLMEDTSFPVRRTVLSFCGSFRVAQRSSSTPVV